MISVLIITRIQAVGTKFFWNSDSWSSRFIFHILAWFKLSHLNFINSHCSYANMTIVGFINIVGSIHPCLLLIWFFTLAGCSFSSASSFSLTIKLQILLNFTAKVIGYLSTKLVCNGLLWFSLILIEDKLFKKVRCFWFLETWFQF